MSFGSFKKLFGSPGGAPFNSATPNPSHSNWTGNAARRDPATPTFPTLDPRKTPVQAGSARTRYKIGEKGLGLKTMPASQKLKAQQIVAMGGSVEDVVGHAHLNGYKSPLHFAKDGSIAAPQSELKSSWNPADWFRANQAHQAVGREGEDRARDVIAEVVGGCILAAPAFVARAYEVIRDKSESKEKRTLYDAELTRMQRVSSAPRTPRAEADLVRLQLGQGGTFNAVRLEPLKYMPDPAFFPGHYPGLKVVFSGAQVSFDISQMVSTPGPLDHADWEHKNLNAMNKHQLLRDKGSAWTER